MSDYVEMGTVGRPHGLAGEMSLRWEGITPVQIGDEVYVGPHAGDLKPFIVKSLRVHKGFPLVGLDCVNNRDQAEMLRGAKVYVAKAALPAPAENEAWLEDLIGAKILLEDGTRLGVLDHLEFPAGLELWSIRGEDGREILFPARPEFIAHIDTEKGEVKIAPPPGLLDIYLA